MKLIFERSVPGRRSAILPPCDVEAAPLDEADTRQRALRLPELSETDVSRHYTELSKQAYGVNCKDFIEQIRVNQVGKYLLFTDMGLEEISQETGYADCSHMIKNFKRIMGITPGQFRLRHR